MIDFGSASVPRMAASSIGVSTWSRVSRAVQPSMRWKYAMAFRRSILLTSARRMCSCGKPSVCPASCRTTRWNSDSGVSMVNSSRFMVASALGICRISEVRDGLPAIDLIDQHAPHVLVRKAQRVPGLVPNDAVELRFGRLHGELFQVHGGDARIGV